MILPSQARLPFALYTVQPWPPSEPPAICTSPVEFLILGKRRAPPASIIKLLFDPPAESVPAPAKLKVDDVIPTVSMVGTPVRSPVVATVKWFEVNWNVPVELPIIVFALPEALMDADPVA